MWSDPVERVASFLREAQAEARLEEYEAGTPSAAAAAEAAGCSLAQIVKSLVFVCDGFAVVALVPGDRRADTAKIAREVGASKARIATAEEVQAATGFAPGAVAPFPLPRVAAVVIDRRLVTQSRVWVGAGSSNHLASLAPKELMRLTKARIVDAVADSQ